MSATNDAFGYQRPEGLSDREWERIRTNTVAFIERLVQAAEHGEDA